MERQTKWDPNAPMTTEGLREFYRLLWDLFKTQWWVCPLLPVFWYGFKDRTEIFAHMTSALGLHGAQCTVAFGVLLIGLVAYLLKRSQQFLYGLVEVVFACVAALNVSAGVRPGEDVFARWATLAGLVYVVSRGMSNLSEGRKKLIETAQNEAAAAAARADRGSNP